MVIVIDKDGEIVIVCVIEGDTLILDDIVLVCVNEEETEGVTDIVLEILGDIVTVTVLVLLGEFDIEAVFETVDVTDIDDVIELEILGDFEIETVFEDVILLDIVFVGLRDLVSELVGLILKLGDSELVGVIEAGIIKSRYATTPENTIEISLVQVINISRDVP